MSHRKSEPRSLSRRSLLKSMGLAPILLRSAPLHGSSLLFAPTATPVASPAFPYADLRLTPHYPAGSPLADVLRLVAPGSDEYQSEKYAFEIESLLSQWSHALQGSVRDLTFLAGIADPSIQSSSLEPIKQTPARTGGGIDVTRLSFSPDMVTGRDRFLDQVRRWLAKLSLVETAEFQIVAIEELSSLPLSLRLHIRFGIVAVRTDRRREERVGHWLTEWSQGQANEWRVTRWQAGEATVAIVPAAAFADVTAAALGATLSYKTQLLHGADYWRTVLDGASGIDVYGNNGVAAGDFDGDGFDDLYVCQPAGLPNRLYRNRGDGSFSDVTEAAGVGVLDGTACALFADFDNRGLQDLLVVCGSGPLLFVNQGNGAFQRKPDAFQFKTLPQGTFTHAAIADYDRDGRLDIYFCLYSYYVGLDQYHYPVPYFDARNGPPNFFLRNQGSHTFSDVTEAAGLNADNNRYSFACAWGDYQSKGLPSLYVANDFGRANLYRNNGDGTFTVVSGEANVQDVGAGMSASWSDYDGDGRQDIYAANMWSSAGQRISGQKQFHARAPEEIRSLYRQHARGNSLYKNDGSGKFQNVNQEAGVEMGRWSWSSDFFDFDHDGYPDLYIANGYISGPDRRDLASFFWRQVVGNSPEDTTPSAAYERGWQALNELIRSDSSWSGYERNVLFANNRDGTFSEVSGALGVDYPDDSRSFALADLDHDGRLELVLKNRNAPQLRILHNVMKDLGSSIIFRLHGRKSNADAIGASITLEAGALRQTRYLQAGTGFLAQHSKELFFGTGNTTGPLRAVIRWPNGLTQAFENIPVNHRIDIEEGSAAFAAKTFAQSPSIDGHPAPSPGIEPLPSVVETWLVEPLKAPGFSLPDLSGGMRDLKSFQGRPVLLNFWAGASPLCREELQQLNRRQSSLTAAGLTILAVNVDTANAAAARVGATLGAFSLDALSFPVLFATEELAGVYNIIYRYLFDRRRDLPIPCSLLLDKGGMIVKVYQGPINPESLRVDLETMPATSAERLKKAFPLGGTPYDTAFLRNDFTYGVAMFQHGYLDQAAESFEQVVAAKPGDPEAYYNLGTLNLRRKNYPQARQYLQQTLKLRPNYPEAWNNLGMMAAQQGHPDEAIASFQQSLLLRPEYAIALSNLGNVYRRQGSFEKAKEALDHALSLQPGDPEINYSLGMFYAQQNQASQAAEYLHKAIALRPQYPEAINNLGVLFVHQKAYAKAEEQFQACIRVAPAFDQSYLNLARLYTLQGDKAKARGILLQLTRLQPQNNAASQALQLLQDAP